MVILAFQQNVDMIDKDYYNQEISYQDKIDAANNLSKEEQARIAYMDKGLLSFTFNPEHIEPNQKVQLKFICYSNPKKDTSMLASVSQNRIMLKPWAKGLYKLRTSWQANDKEFYLEKDVLF